MATCTICKKEIDSGCFVGTIDGGAAHRRCFQKQNPPKAVRTIYQMARGCGDPVLAAEVIAKMVPDDIATEIVEEFNRRLLIDWQRRCEP